MINLKGKYFIGGSSHCGKSTLAQYISDTHSLKYLTTDRLARHPGRPWRDNIDQLSSIVQDFYKYTIEYFQNSDIDNLLDDVLEHYTNNIHPLLKQKLVGEYANKNTIIEGSAVLPTLISNEYIDKSNCIWIISDDNVTRNRIIKNSNYYNRNSIIRNAIDNFTLRSIAFNNYIYNQVINLGLNYMKIDESMNEDKVYNEYMKYF